MDEPNAENPEIQDIRKMLALLNQKLDSLGGGEKPKAKSKADGTSRIPIIPAPPEPMDLKGKIELALTRESLETQKLAKVVGESVEKVSLALKDLRAADKIYNVGYEDTPVWTWKVGNDADTETLTQVVRRLASERPMYLRDLVRATGAKESRVSGVMVEIQRTERVVDMSGGGHAKMYLIVSDKVKDASLPPKRVKTSRPSKR